MGTGEGEVGKGWGLPPTRWNSEAWAFSAGLCCYHPCMGLREGKGEAGGALWPDLGSSAREMGRPWVAVPTGPVC